MFAYTEATACILCLIYCLWCGWASRATNFTIRLQWCCCVNQATTFTIRLQVLRFAVHRRAVSLAHHQRQEINRFQTTSSTRRTIVFLMDQPIHSNYSIVSCHCMSLTNTTHKKSNLLHMNTIVRHAAPVV